MKNFTLILMLFILIGCVNHAKTLNGNWQQHILGYEGEKTGYGIVADSAIIRLNLKNPKTITFHYNDGYADDLGDSIVFKHPVLSFRKQNLNQTYNRYKMNYIIECDCWNGTFKSFSGNTIKVTWVRN